MKEVAKKWLKSGWVMERRADLKRGEQGDSDGIGAGQKSGCTDVVRMAVRLGGSDGRRWLKTVVGSAN